MKNPFKKLGKKKNTSKVSIPWNENQNRDDENLKKTIVGKRPQNLSCPKCEYLLITAPSKASPCPNCGFVGNQKIEIPEKPDDNGGTAELGNLIFDNGQSAKSYPKATKFSFNLVLESSGGNIFIEGEEKEVTLNRDVLDPGNSTISSEQHIQIRLNEHQFWIKDLSSNGSTFLQALERVLLKDGCRIVLGNKLLKFSCEGSETNIPDDGNTKMFGQFNMAPQFSNGNFFLLDEMTQQVKKFQEQKTFVSRDNIEPGNKSLSSRQHALFEFESGNWFLTDKSSNGATFVQVIQETPVNNGQKMLLGNKIFRFEYK